MKAGLIELKPVNSELIKKILTHESGITRACYATVSVLIQLSSRHVHGVAVNCESRQN